MHHLLLFRRSPELTGAGDALNTRALAAWRTAHTAADLRGIHVELCKGPTQGITVHAKLFGGFTLIALMVRKHFENVALLELTYGIRVWDTSAVHLSNKSVEFALQG